MQIGIHHPSMFCAVDQWLIFHSPLAFFSSSSSSSSSSPPPLLIRPWSVSRREDWPGRAGRGGAGWLALGEGEAAQTGRPARVTCQSREECPLRRHQDAKTRRRRRRRRRSGGGGGHHRWRPRAALRTTIRPRGRLITLTRVRRGHRLRDNKPKDDKMSKWQDVQGQKVIFAKSPTQKMN